MCVFNKFIHLCMHERSQSFITPPKPISLLQHVVGGHARRSSSEEEIVAQPHIFFRGEIHTVWPLLDRPIGARRQCCHTRLCCSVGSHVQPVELVWQHDYEHIRIHLDRHEVSVLITVAFYVNEMDEGDLGHDEHVI